MATTSGPLLQRLRRVTLARGALLGTTNMSTGVSTLGHPAGLVGILGPHTPRRLASVVASKNGKHRPGSNFSEGGHHPGAKRGRRLKVYYNQLSPELRYILFSGNPSVVKESKPTEPRSSGSSTSDTSASSRTAPKATGQASDKARVENYMKEIDGLVEQCQATVQMLQSTLKQRQQRQVALEHRLDQTKADNVRQATLVSQLTHKLQHQSLDKPPTSTLSAGSLLTGSKSSCDKKVVGCACVSDHHYNGGVPRQSNRPSAAVPLRTSSTVTSPTSGMSSVASHPLERPLTTPHALSAKWVWIITAATGTATLGLVFSDSIVALV
ncbi:hypothetical protein IWQ62_006025 [Dispira parvispora]|uniref:Uncharacterized protein n=1 Tax=Dispira parvispora TaxID=1520584 RepID=A0A9W8APX3_9FUNG|nr:hypothetical protein IWQ62_006025 [Dispira parvispora]